MEDHMSKGTGKKSELTQAKIREKYRGGKPKHCALCELQFAEVRGKKKERGTKEGKKKKKKKKKEKKKEEMRCLAGDRYTDHSVHRHLTHTFPRSHIPTFARAHTRPHAPLSLRMCLPL